MHGKTRSRAVTVEEHRVEVYHIKLAGSLRAQSCATPCTRAFVIHIRCIWSHLRRRIVITRRTGVRNG